MYFDMDGIKHAYSDFGVVFIEDCENNRAIVKDAWTGNYTIWSKNANRPLSKIGRNNIYLPIYFDSLESCYMYLLG